jgi:uroporphyrin-3 C-methyltransferase
MTEQSQTPSVESTTPTVTTANAFASAGATPTTPTAQNAVPAWRQPSMIASGVLAVLLVAQWWNYQNQMTNLRAEVARRLQSADISQSEVKVVAKALQEASKDVVAKVSILENKQTEAQGQQAALEQLYQDLSKNRDEWALAEIEQVLATASQQLQLAGNVQGALIALQNADARLAKSEKVQFITVRRAIAKDIETLKSLPMVDLTGLVLRLDSVIAQVDQIPLLSDEKLPVAATPPKVPLRLIKVKNPDSKTPAETELSFSARMQDRWQSFSTEMWSEVKQLVRIRNVQHPDALFLSPEQAFFARENLKLRLLNARLALLSRNENAFRSDMINAQDVIAKYFDVRAKQAQTVQSLLKQIQNSNLSIEMPALTESLNSVRNFKVKP